MAVIRLQFDVDATLHPELYRLLYAIKEEDARAERLRQLAGTGLLWEDLRLQAAAAGSPSLQVPPLGREIQSAGAPAPFEPQSGPAADPVVVQTGPVPAPELVPAGRLHAAAWPAPSLAQEAGAPDDVFLREIANAMEQLPVLTETIDPAQFHAEPPAAPTAHLRRTATRSRLLRMKEKGLFKNE